MTAPIELDHGGVKEDERCVEQDCRGVASTTGACLRHELETNPQGVAKILEDQHAAGIVDLRGVEIDAVLLALVLETAPVDDEDDRRRFDRARFDWARFQSDVLLADVRFKGEVGFAGATFAKALTLQEVAFGGIANFQGAQFKAAVLESVEFGGTALFDEATFAGKLIVANTTMGRTASLRNVTFAEVSMTSSRFSADAIFERCEFGAGLSLQDVEFRRDATFADSSFQSARMEGIIVLRELTLEGVTTAKPLLIRGGARSVNCQRAQLLAPVTLELRRAEFVLDEANFAAPSVITTGPPTADTEDLLRACAAQDLGRFTRTARARVLSLQRANVENLTLGQVDLLACRFFGAYNLSQLSIEASDAFASTPPSRRWSRRQAIAEEHEWRRGLHPGTSPWYDGAVRGTQAVPALQRLGPPEIAAVYRALRRGREESKDEPGAADFYYGEMEMRRHARRIVSDTAEAAMPPAGPRLLAERAVLTAYWAISGYGLRASRALGALLVVLVLCTPILYLYGFQDREHPFAGPDAVAVSPPLGFPPPVKEVLNGLTSGDSWAYALGTATSVIGAPESQLTSEGRFIRIALRILGPVLIALAVLAIRARVKR
jgi:uncharacterized protein YjbI with pentapeptide repeats